MVIQKIHIQPERYFWPCMGIIVILTMAGVFMNMSGSLELDEPFSANLANSSWKEMFNAFLHDPAAPLYYVLLKPWVNIFGESEVAVRSFSAICFASTIIVVGLTARSMGGTFGGITAALLASISDIGLIYARTARPYALLSLLTSIGTLFFFYIVGLIRADASIGSRRSFQLAGFVTINVLGLLTHPIFIFLMIALNAVAWIQGRRSFWLVVLCNLVTMGIYLAIWGPILFRTINLPAISWMEVPDIKDLIHGYLNLWGLARTIVLGAFVLFASIWNFRTMRDFLLSRTGLISSGILLTTSLLPFLVSQYKPVFDDSRTPSMFFPIASVFIALLLVRLKNSGIALGILVIMLGSAVVSPLFTTADPATEHSPRASIRYVLENTRCGDTIISGGLSNNETTYYLRRLRAPDCIEHRIFPESLYEHPGWMDPPSLLEHSAELEIEAKSLVNELDRSHSRVWFLYEHHPYRQPVLAILKTQLDQEMVLRESLKGYGTFFDSILVYGSGK